MVGLAIVAVLAVFIGSSLPGGFIPTEDQGYMFLALQLPDGASAQRTDAAEQKISDALLKTPGVQGVIAVNNFSLLTQVQSTNAGFFFVALKPWETRKSKQQQLEYIQSHLQQQLAADPDGIAFAFPPPSIPGHRNFRRRNHGSGGSLGNRRSYNVDEERVRFFGRAEG